MESMIEMIRNSYRCGLLSAYVKIMLRARYVGQGPRIWGTMPTHPTAGLRQYYRNL